MTAQEQLTLDIIVKIQSGKMGRKEAQKVLNVSERTLRRYLSDYHETGPLSIKHGNCNKVPVNQTDVNLKKRVQGLVQEVYFDFNLTHLGEKLKSEHGIEVKREVLRLWCHEIKMVKRTKRKRSSKVRKRRDRMAQSGLMLQMDGSPHHWFGGRPSCLIATIDDADNDVAYGEFFASEDTISCMVVLQKIIEKRGIFEILYVDKAGIFAGPKRSDFSQVKRACGELGIHIIYANSPEAKGRIERFWDTCQDRLVPEMRLLSITTYDAANNYLQNKFLASDYPALSKVIPENLVPAYKPLPAHIDLKEIFCLKNYRTCKRDHTFSDGNELYRIDSDLKHSIYKQQIEIRTYQDLSVKYFFAGKELEVSPIKENEKARNTARIEEISPHKVRQDQHVVFNERYYSVAFNYIGTTVSVIERDEKVYIYQQGSVIETHLKIKDPYQFSSTHPDHQRASEIALKIDSEYRRNARRYGMHVEAFVIAVIKRGQGFIDNNTIFGVLNQDKNYSAEFINEACKYALEIDVPHYKVVRTFLKLKPTLYEQKQAAKAL